AMTGAVEAVGIEKDELPGRSIFEKVPYVLESLAERVIGDRSRPACYPSVVGREAVCRWHECVRMDAAFVEAGVYRVVRKKGFRTYSLLLEFPGVMRGGFAVEQRRDYLVERILVIEPLVHPGLCKRLSAVQCRHVRRRGGRKL